LKRLKICRYFVTSQYQLYICYIRKKLDSNARGIIINRFLGDSRKISINLCIRAAPRLKVVNWDGKFGRNLKYIKVKDHKPGRGIMGYATPRILLCTSDIGIMEGGYAVSTY
jgi:hypothetical protein